MDRSQTRYRFKCEYLHSETATVRQYDDVKLGFGWVGMKRGE